MKEKALPSHETLSYVFGALDAEKLEHCFSGWVQSLAELLPG